MSDFDVPDQNPAARTASGPIVSAAAEHEPPGHGLVDDDLARRFVPALTPSALHGVRWRPLRHLLIAAQVVHGLPGNEWRRIQRAQGYKYVLVTGQVALENDEPTNVASGHLLRAGKTSNQH
jgi:hypothetical protein